MKCRRSLTRTAVAIENETAEECTLSVLDGQKRGTPSILDLWLVDAVRRKLVAVPAASREQQQQEQSMSRIGWLSTSILHDLKNPLATVFASAEMLMELDPASSQAKRLTVNIYKSACCMRDLLKGLAKARVENRSVTERCKIRDVILNALNAARSTRETQQTVEIVFDVSKQLEILVERVRTEKVFFNLIINALEAMPRGGTISICARRAHHRVLIEVEDTGPGLSPAILDKLFEPFATAGKAHGLGLGLALSRQVVLDQGGDMWVEPASGARFVISLPLAVFTSHKR